MLKRGDVVLSAAGRDKGLLLAVADAAENEVFVCNGKARPLRSPKRKNLRHVQFVGRSLPEEAFASDRALRKALAIMQTDLT